MAAKFENEVFEDTDNLPDPIEELRQKTTDALYGEAEVVTFDRDTGEVLEETVKPSVRLVEHHLDNKRMPKAGKRIKRTEAEMIASLGGSALKEATYVAERISKLEDKITELMGAVGQKAREHILNDFPHLSRY